MAMEGSDFRELRRMSTCLSTKTRDYQTLHSNIGGKPNSNNVVEGGNPNIKWRCLVFNYIVKAKTAQHVDSRD